MQPASFRRRPGLPLTRLVWRLRGVTGLLTLTLLAGCATTEPYVGPVGPPTLTGTEWLWLDINGRLRRETTLHVTNSSYAQLDGILDCTTHPKALRMWAGTRLTLHIPARTTQHVLLAPHDHNCSLLPMEE